MEGEKKRMKRNLYYTSADGETRIHAILWIPEGEVRAVLQISHGMVEYIGRYERFAEYLNEYGICVVAVSYTHLRAHET